MEKAYSVFKNMLKYKYGCCLQKKRFQFKKQNQFKIILKIAF